MKKVILGTLENKEKVSIDLTNLIDTRLLITANSGGGKSWLIRRLLEQTHGQVQQIVIDLEGEFPTLREKYDYLLVAKDGDIPISVKTSELLAKKLLELNVSTIIDLSDLKFFERILFVKKFLAALIEAPKNLRHPVLVVIDEAHQFCPQHEKSESTSEVIDLMTRGRKRGLCGVLATQRISKISKDAIAECNNKLIGRTGLDVDMKRASEELGFTSKEQMFSLRNLSPGEYFGFGPSISREVIKIKIGDVNTTHPKSGERQLIEPTVTPEAIKKILGSLKDLPKEQEQELKTKEDMQKKISELTRELRLKTINQPKQESKIDGEMERKKDIENKQLIKEMQNKINSLDIAYKNIIKNQDKEFNIKIKGYEKEANIKLNYFVKMVNQCRNTLSSIAKQAESAKNVDPNINNLINFELTTSPYKAPSTELIKHEEDVKKVFEDNRRLAAEVSTKQEILLDSSIGASHLKILECIISVYPESMDKIRIATITGFSSKSGTFGTYLSALKVKGLIELKDGGYKATEEGFNKIPNPKEMPKGQELIQFWCRKVVGAGKLLKALCDIYPDKLTKEELAERVIMSASSGTFGTYLSKLKVNRLIESTSEGLKASKELFE